MDCRTAATLNICAPSTSGRRFPVHTNVIAYSSCPARATRLQCTAGASIPEAKGEVTLLDYGAGNVRSVKNAVKRLGYDLKEVKSWDGIVITGSLIPVGCY